MSFEKKKKEKNLQRIVQSIYDSITNKIEKKEFLSWLMCMGKFYEQQKLPENDTNNHFQICQSSQIE